MGGRRAGDGELARYQEIVVARLHKVDEVHQIGLLLITLRKLDHHAVQQQAVHAAVAHHHLWLAHRLQRMGGLLQGGGRDERVDAGQSGQEPFSQHHLPVVGALGGVAVGGDVWAVGVEKRQLVHFPKGDLSKGRIVCEGDSAEPCKSFKAPFHLAIDQQDRIWVSNSALDHVTRFSAADPSKAEKFKTGFNNSGLAIDSQGNVWITERFGSGLLGLAHLIDLDARLKLEGVAKASDYLTKTMSEQKGGSGSVTVLRPDGTPYPGSPFKGGGLPGPWAAVVDGNDNVWISNFAMPSSPIVQLCGTRTENCPPGMKTGDQISPPGGYVGGGLQMLTDIAVDPAGNVWVMNNWQDIDSCYPGAIEALSTRCGGQGVVIFFGMAKPVKTPQIGPAVAAGRDEGASDRAGRKAHDRRGRVAHRQPRAPDPGDEPGGRSRATGRADPARRRPGPCRSTPCKLRWS